MPSIPPERIAAVVDEICAVTGWAREEVAARVAAEIAEPGSSVCRDAKRLGVRWHVFDAAMGRLYGETDGFIYETMVFWASGARSAWIEHARERLDRLCALQGIAREDLRVLMWGDGTGSDTLALAGAGYRLDVHEYPGSRTYDFLQARLAHHGLLGTAVRMLPDPATLKPGSYDAIVCFEVLEHVPDAPAMVRRIAELLRPGGAALVTEGFREVWPSLPTHLRVNLRHAGRTPFLFREAGLHLAWFAARPRFKPSEYRKLERPGLGERLRLLHPRVVKHWVAARRLRAEGERAAAGS